MSNGGSHILEVVDTSSLAETLEQDLGMERLDWRHVHLNRRGAWLGRPTLKSRGIARPHIGFKWNSEDASSTSWYPQGITGLRQGSRRFIAVSWYHRGSDHARMSLVNVANFSELRYRHVVLVEPAPDGDRRVFRPITSHAGGLATRGNLIYSAETGYGVRVFDSTRIFKVRTRAQVEDHYGMQPVAFGYQYVMPQVAKYKLDQDGTRFSFCSMDRTDPEQPMLLTGNYHSSSASYDNPPPTLAWWILAAGEITGRRRLVNTGLRNRTQGAIARGDNVWLSRSGGTPRLFAGPPGDLEAFSWPHGCEDLHLSLSGNLWCLTEHPNERIVFAVKLADYMP